MWIRVVIAGGIVSALLGPGTAGAAGENAQRAAPDGMTYARDVAVHGGDHIVIGRSRAVYSIRLAALAPGEILRIRAETELTSCRASDTGCGAANREPRLQVRLILANGPTDVAGLTLATAHTKCRLDSQHCPLILRRTFTVNAVQSRRSHVNLVVSSKAPGANPGDLLEIKQSPIAKGGGHLTVLRAGRDYRPDSIVVRDDHEDVAALPIQTGFSAQNTNPPPVKTVVYSVPIIGLQHGEMLDVEGVLRATMDARVRKAGTPALLASQILLATSPTETDVDAVAQWQRIAPNTGFNCVDTCTVRKIGAIRIVARDVPALMYVNYIAQSSRTTAAANMECMNPDCDATIRDSGGLSVRRLGVGGGAAAASNGSCGTVIVASPIGLIGLRVTKSKRSRPDPVSCGEARRLIRNVWSGRPNTGWFCSPPDIQGYTVCLAGMRIGWTVEARPNPLLGGLLPPA